MSKHDARPLACENCTTALQGDFCHVCGQSAHSPLRSFGHAVEEVFESFWHLDGRIFRTLRDLLVPGRLALAYLGGKRVSYIPPLRLFVVLSLLTFFVARLAVHIDNGQAQAVVAGNATRSQATFEQARTAEEVETTRKQLIADLVKAREEMPANIPGARAGFDASIAVVDKQAKRRLKELGAPLTTAPEAKWAESEADERIGEKDNKVQTPLPDFADHWLEGEVKRINDNLPRLREDPQRLVNAFFSAVPSTLFVLVPLFALLLRVFYLFSGRVYLEHLVIALYSHAFLCLDLLVVLLLMLVEQAIGARLPGVGLGIGLLQFLLVMWMPVYLLVMQQRVYRQFWLVTLIKYSVLGGIYFTVVTVIAAVLGIASIARI